MSKKKEKYSQSKEQKDAKAAGVSPEELEAMRRDWGHCQYFLRKKRRLCPLPKEAGSQHCSAHAKETACALRALEQQSRVPCPLDPSHSVYSHKLQQHLAKCRALVLMPPPTPASDITTLHTENSTVSATRGQRPPLYFCKDCNSAPHIDTDIDSTDEGGRVKDVDPDALLAVIMALYDSFAHKDIEPLADLPHIVVPEEAIVSAVSGGKSSFAKTRHALQDVCIVKHLISADLLCLGPSRDNTSPELATSLEEKEGEEKEVTTYVELGAGNGLLGLAVTTALQPPPATTTTEGTITSTPASYHIATNYDTKKNNQNQRNSRERSKQGSEGSTSAQLVMVERAGSKKNGDRRLVSQQFKSFVRVRMDLRDCLLSQLPGIGAACSSTSSSSSSGSNGGGGGDGVGPGTGRGVVLRPATRVVLLAKHLCGVATDVSLRGTASFSLPPPSPLTSSGLSSPHQSPSPRGTASTVTATSTAAETATVSDIDTVSSSDIYNDTHSLFGSCPRVLSPRLQGVAIATCCHHACAWRDYVGGSFLNSLLPISNAQQKIGGGGGGMTSIGEAEFEVLKHWAGWAHCFNNSQKQTQKQEMKEEKNNASDTYIRSDTYSSSSSSHAGPVRKRSKVDTQEDENEENEKYDENDEDHENEISSVTSSTIRDKEAHTPRPFPRPSLLSSHPHPQQEMSRIGKAVKRVLDQGRVHYLRSLGLRARQVQYCSPTLSPECFLILATRDGNSSTFSSSSNGSSTDA